MKCVPPFAAARKPQRQPEFAADRRVRSEARHKIHRRIQARPHHEMRAQNRPARSMLARPKRTQSLLKTTFFQSASHSIGKAFRGYEPAIDLFPVELWARIAARVYRKAPRFFVWAG